MLSGYQPKAVVRGSNVTRPSRLASAAASHSDAGCPSIAALGSLNREPPSSACSSQSMTRTPVLAAASAAAMPAGPAPMTKTSQ